MRIGKLENNQLIDSLSVIDGLINCTKFIGENWVSNPTIEQMAGIGYKPMVESTMPLEQEGLYITEIYSENETEILINYEFVEIQLPYVL